MLDQNHAITQKNTMTRFEGATLFISSLALGVSLLAAAVTPWITYHWLDPAAKPFKDRAVFVTVHSDITEPIPDRSPKQGSNDVKAEIALKNIGRLPANNPKI